RRARSNSPWPCKPPLCEHAGIMQASRGAVPARARTELEAQVMRQRPLSFVNALTGLILVSTLTGTAQAQDGWSFKNRPITLYTAGTPGGGYDFYARLLARHLGRHLPGNPSIVVKNMPGAGGVVLANHLQARAA